MNLTVASAAVDQQPAQTKGTGLNAEEGWLKALEEAHFEKQRGSMEQASSDGREATGEWAENGEAQSRAPERQMAEWLPENDRVGHPVVVNTGGRGVNVSSSGLFMTPAQAPVHAQSVSATDVVASTPPVARNHGIELTAGKQELAENTRPFRFVPPTEFSSMSVKLLPGQSGYELVIRSQKDLGPELASTIREVKTVLALNNQKLSSVRLNGDALSNSDSVLSETDLSVDMPSQHINKIY